VRQAPLKGRIWMKKVLFAGLIFAAATLSAHGIGLYFDAGVGIGPGWTKIDGDDIVEIVTEKGKPDEIAVELGLKIGLGPFDTIPIHIVGVLGGMMHRISDSQDNYYQFSSYLVGPGAVFYPVSFLQIAASLGYSFVSNETSFIKKEYMYESKGGIAGDISVAFDLGAGKHGLLGGIKFFGSTNTLKSSGVVQNTSMVSFFLRYAFRHKK
jgi:hypothetical protein